MLSSGDVGEIGASVLIIAMPKSASSSLARTLARHHGLDERNDDINAEHPPQFLDRHLLLQELHPFPDVPSEELRTIVADGSALRKLHLFPTPGVQSAIADGRTVVLLREPMAVVDAEFRAVVNGIHRRTPSMPRTTSIARWRTVAVEKGLLDSLEELRESWRALASGHPGVLLLDFREVMSDPSEALSRCAEHLGIPVPDELPLLRERYSGAPTARWSGDAPGAARSFTYTLGAVARRGGRALRRRARRLVRGISADRGH